MKTVSRAAFALATMVLAAAPGAASATSLAGNLFSNDEGSFGDLGPTSTDPTHQVAAGFVATSSGTVASLLVVAQASGGDEPFTLELRADEGGSPGALLAAGSGVASLDADRVTVAVEGAPQVERGLCYWVVFADAGSGGVRWSALDGTAASLLASRDGGPWSALAAEQPVLRVSGTVGESPAAGPAMPGPDGTQSAGSASALTAAGGDAPRRIADDPTLAAPAPEIASRASSPALGEVSVDGAGGCQAGGAAGGSGFVVVGLALVLAFRRQRN